MVYVETTCGRIRRLISLCREIEDRISELHKRKELKHRDDLLVQLRELRRKVFEVRNDLEAWATVHAD